MNEFTDLIKTRRSIREYKQIPVSFDVLKEIVDAGRFAPSPHNIQPWEFIIVQREENCDSLYLHLGWLYESDKSSRPVSYIVVITEKKNLKNLSIVASLGASIENMLLSAWSHGIGSCWIGSIKDKNGLKKFLKIPEDFTIFAVITLGYPLNIPETIDTNIVLKPFFKDGKLFVPKLKIDKVLHIEKF